MRNATSEEDAVTMYGFTKQEIKYLATGFAAFLGAIVGVVVVSWVMN